MLSHTTDESECQNIELSISHYTLGTSWRITSYTHHMIGGQSYHSYQKKGYGHTLKYAVDWLSLLGFL